MYLTKKSGKKVVDSAWKNLRAIAYQGIDAAESLQKLKYILCSITIWGCSLTCSVSANKTVHLQEYVY